MPGSQCSSQSVYTLLVDFFALRADGPRELLRE
jgi:hypothetical protein